MNPDGTNAEIIGHNYRNSYEQSVTSLGDVFQNDNDDPPACRVSWVMEYANFGFSSNDGQRTLAGGPPARPDDAGRGVASGRSGHDAGRRRLRRRLADRQRVLRERRARRRVGRHVPRRRRRAQRDLLLPAGAPGRRVRARSEDLPDVERQAAVRRARTSSAARGGVTGAVETLFRPSDIAVGPDGAMYVSDWIDARVGGHQDLDDTLSGAIYRIAPKGFVSKVPAFDAATIDGLITALRSPAVNVRAIGFEGLKARGAAAVNAVAALLNDPSPYIRGRAIYLLYQLGPEGQTARGHAGVADRSGAAHRRLPRDAPRGPRRPAGGSHARRATPMPASGARWRCRCAISRPTRRCDILVDDRARLRRPGSQLPRSAREPAPPARSRRSTSGCGASLGVKDDPLTWSASLRADRVAAARAGGGAGPDRARAVVEAVARRPPPRAWTRSRSSAIPRRRRRCSRSRSRTARCVSRRRGGC